MHEVLKEVALIGGSIQKGQQTHSMLFALTEIALIGGSVLVNSRSMALYFTVFPFALVDSFGIQNFEGTLAVLHVPNPLALEFVSLGVDIYAIARFTATVHDPDV
jgi:hypothetical protein